MGGWETSRHPEWEQMYAAGITVREIADVVKHPRATVHKHLEIRELYIPGLRATHEAARAQRVPGWPTHLWHARLDALAAFVATEGRAPKGWRVNTEEASLYQWFRYQRQLLQKGTLHPAKIAALDEAWPDWTKDNPREFLGSFKADDNLVRAENTPNPPSKKQLEHVTN